MHLRTKMATKALTFGVIKGLQERPDPYELPDPGQPGLLWRVQPSGVKSAIVTWARGKRMTHKRHFPSLTPEAARVWARKALHEADKHGAPLDARPKTKAGDIRTFEDFLTMRYRDAIAGNLAKDATLANIRA